MGAWTAGPWRVSDGAILSDKLNAYGNWIVCDIRRELVEEDKANAHLIAAAPTMAEALQQVVCDCNEWMGNEDSDLNSALSLCEALVEQSRLALARAEGKP